jgi:hypothetical protein
LNTTTRPRRGIGLFFHFFQRGRAINNGIDDIHRGHIHTGAEILVQVLLETGWQFVQWIGIGISFQNSNKLLNENKR